MDDDGQMPVFARQMSSEVQSFDQSRPQTLNPEQPIRVQLQETFALKRVLIIAGSMALSVVMAYTVLEDVQFEDGRTPSTPVPTWKPLFVMNLIVIFVVLVRAGGSPDVLMLGLSAAAVVVGCLDGAKLFKGASSGTVTALACLFPISKALDDTGWPALIVGKVLGSPKSRNLGVARVFMATVPMSGFIANVPVVNTLIPVIMAWSQRLDFEPRVFMICLSFAASTGGTLTLLGSPMNFIAKDVFLRQFKLGFLDLTLGSCILSMVVAVYCVVVAPLMFGSKTEPDARADVFRESMAGTSSRAVVSRNKSNVYNIEMLVVLQGPLVGKLMIDVGIHRFKGVHTVHLARAKGTSLIGGESGLDMHSAPMIETGDVPQDGGQDGGAGTKLRSGDVIRVQATAEAIASLRDVYGLEIGNEQSELQTLGPNRRMRRLMEAAVGGELIGVTVDTWELRHKLGCAIVGLRRSSPMPWMRSFDRCRLEEGDVLLIEGETDSIGSELWAEHFGVVRIVEKSRPRRTSNAPDTMRAVATALGLLTIIFLSATNQSGLTEAGLTLNTLCVLLLCFLISIQAITVKEAQSSVNVGVLLTIIGAFALGDAVQDTGLANFIADDIIVKFCRPFGVYGVLVGLYMATASLVMCMRVQAVMVIMGEIGIRVAADIDGLAVQTVALVIIYAGSSSWMAAYGYATNVMVMPFGNYTWGDFMKFGAPLQLIHMIVTVLIAPWCASFMMSYLP